jgi:hypothetical protein
MNLQEWLEQKDIESRGFSRGTWIPLMVDDYPVHEGAPMQAGYISEFRSIETLVVKNADRHTFRNAEWDSIQRNGSHSAWAHEGKFHAPDKYYRDDDAEPTALYPVLRQGYETEPHDIWDLNQEITHSLRLLRKGDSWIRPSENRIEVARLRRQSDGAPGCLEMRAEFLRDYLKARDSALLVGGFIIREVVREDFPDLDWNDGSVEREFSHGEWEGARHALVDDAHLQHAQGRIWWTEWVEPAAKSTRVAEEEDDHKIQFIVDNQGGERLSGIELEQHHGWLWFSAGVVRDILRNDHATLKWHSLETASIGAGAGRNVYFGVNSIGLLQVWAKDIAQLPVWFQRMWFPHNVTPEGGVSGELITTQVRAWFNSSTAPEKQFVENLFRLANRTVEKFGTSLLKNPAPAAEVSRTIHRFYDSSFESVCLLAKEMCRHVVEKLDAGEIDKLLSPENKKLADEKKYRSLKRLELLITQHGEDGRRIAQPLAGLNDLRQGDAHPKSSDLRESLQLFGFTPDTEDYSGVCVRMISDTADCLGNIAVSLIGPSQSPSSSDSASSAPSGGSKT